MTGKHPLEFRIAATEAEFDQIHRLNYAAFVEEIPQHPANPSRRSVDRFHRENDYIVCVADGEVVGSLAIRRQRPFSLDEKLPDLDSYLPPDRSLCEVRLLSIRKEFRHGTIFRDLGHHLLRYCQKRGLDTVLISGTTTQLKLYAHLGFRPFGPLVGTREASFQPMLLTAETFARRGRTYEAISRKRPRRDEVNLLPGPVGLSSRVRRAFSADPVSHRSRSFLDQFHEVQARLCDLVNAPLVQILLGSGSLANDAIAGQLALQNDRGLVVSNGEFGRRLVDHAQRFQLNAGVLDLEWGTPLTRESIESALDADPHVRWLWFVHCETSTGMLNDLELFREIARSRKIDLVVDCISSIGTTPVDLDGVRFASCVSGKGLRSYPGLAIVFHDRPLSPAPGRLPRYLDLGLYENSEGVAFTHSSNLVAALSEALKSSEPSHFEHLLELSSSLRSSLVGIGLPIVTPQQNAAPAVITIALPRSIDSCAVGDQLESRGLLLSYRSGYLIERNWIQICLMSLPSPSAVTDLLDNLRELCGSATDEPEQRYQQ